ncbi:RDD family protein [Dokdonia sp. Hel_I_53]|uniref:RDD family protein n=1 Tax=Dokdonia sp. Hel_I_53 TaxID=1566287 RepID=UPI00119C3DAF|nr:RDD family protein [Dokdonia sp. Hel_I_53]TVZ51127.1 putative RDD family membrane protein YckC [Dokdonia sp. Hel_I_53]
MDNFQIETAQNVSIYQNVSGIGERIVAFIIDGIILIAYWIVSLLLLAKFGLESQNFRDIWVFYLIIGLPVFLYYLLFETFWNGKTPGKAAMKLKVVKLDGSKPGFGSFFVRWIMRIVDISITSGGIAVVSILMTERGQRLGDMAAGTTVITERKRVRLSDSLMIDIPDDYKPLYPQVTVFNDKDVQLIKTLFVDARKNANHNVIVKLAEKLQAKMGVTPEETNIDFIERVLADYNYYTQQ